ncbi:hypothetical protein [Pedobacter flavus]|uniref:Uncharacterized protein n=1 Tax=Pedobacter flavus TaxID=3113906 RepID=A0ABU7GY34_9SPHI|nr:hypothetical protein [Pedobacter sp. VNH31]MEE1883947.1 hypothetical protein [Pedobacter sp. VNH31]
MIQPDDIFKKIGFILNDLQDQHDYLTHHPEKLNLPELQLFKANADFLADHIKIYIGLYEKLKAEVVDDSKFNMAQTPVLNSQEEEQQSLEEADVNSILDAKVNIETDDSLLNVDKPTFEFLLNSETNDEDVFEFEQSAVGEIFDRTLSEEENEILNKAKEKIGLINDPIEMEEDLFLGDNEEVGPEPFLINEQEIIEGELDKTDAFEESRELLNEDFNFGKEEILPIVNTILPQQEEKKQSINELLASASGARASNLVPIKDLKQAINLNDKLLFIRDLFNGYNLAYSEAVDILNKMSDFKSAQTFLENTYSEKNGWKDKQGTVDRFYELLARKFPEG